VSQFDKEKYRLLRKENKRGQGLDKPWNKVYKASKVEIHFTEKGEMVAMPRYLRRKNKKAKKDV